MTRLIRLIPLAGLVLAACATAPARTTNPPAATEPEGAATIPASSAPALLPVQTPPAGAAAEFSTDFSKSTVRFDEVLSGGPPKDGIPAIDAPKFVSIADADAWLKPNEPVALINVNGDARAYPVQVLTWHEIVNDAVGGVPLAVTYCPLCNTAIAFERTFDGRELDFGTTGRLRYSNLIMYDRQTETWWQQGTGQAIAGQYAGLQLTQRPMTLISWADFKAAHPDGQVLDRDTGFARSYGRNPYVGYDNPSTQPFLYQGPATPNLLPALARVFALNLNDDPVAFAYDALAQRRALTDVVGGEPVVVLWTPGTASALDAPLVSDGRDVGAAASFSRVLDGQTLDFAVVDDAVVDAQTGSRWDGLGRAVDGPLKGKQLTEVVGTNHFWFSWAAFHPTTRLQDGATP